MRRRIRDCIGSCTRIKIKLEKTDFDFLGRDFVRFAEELPNGFLTEVINKFKVILNFNPQFEKFKT